MRQIYKIKAQQSEIVSEAKGNSPTFFASKLASVEIEFEGEGFLNQRRIAFAKQSQASEAQLKIEEEEEPKKPWYKCC
jgi:hypothetical protein